MDLHIPSLHAVDDTSQIGYSSAAIARPPLQPPRSRASVVHSGLASSEQQHASASGAEPVDAVRSTRELEKPEGEKRMTDGSVPKGSTP